jgi:hypothetical protein
MRFWDQHTAAWVVVVALLAVIAAMSLHHGRHGMSPIVTAPRAEIVPADRPDRRQFDDEWTDDTAAF